MKKTLTLLLLAALLTAPLAGCSDTDDTLALTTEGADNGTDTIPEYNAAEANPASDFKYEVNDDGGITITKYIGTDTNVVIPEKIEGKNVTVIGEGAFRENQTLTSVAMPDSIIQLHSTAFYGCKGLQTVVLSAQLKIMYRSVFDGCTQLSNIHLPDSLTYIGERAFALCKSLKKITIPASCYQKSGNGYWAADGVFENSGLEVVEIKDGVQYIPTYAFYKTNIKEIVIPKSVQKIDEGAFSSCENLTKITLSEGLTTIARTAFKNTSIVELVIPSTVNDMTCAALEDMACLEKLYFEGNTPNYFIVENNQGENAPFTVYYHEGAEGFTTPEWNGYKTEIW